MYAFVIATVYISSWLYYIYVKERENNYMAINKEILLINT